MPFRERGRKKLVRLQQQDRQEGPGVLHPRDSSPSLGRIQGGEGRLEEEEGRRKRKGDMKGRDMGGRDVEKINPPSSPTTT